MAWKRTIRVKQYLFSEITPETIKTLANGALKALENEPTAPKNGFNKVLEYADSDPQTALLVVNAAMNSLYDWADDNRVWIE